MSIRARQELRDWKRRTRRQQQEIARRLGISAPYLSQILNGARVPSLAVMARIEELAGVPLRAWVEQVNHNRQTWTQSAPIGEN